ncbi:pyrroloquinoline quinone biosynthesis protein PqqB [Acidocella aromatica]|uniref:Coenzyme PQQ synthesis protein B n=1 Tax=Acidocella aromatica TaxID=1303579 RepID=A0A840VKS8_9PROT|nr:pyrroloquinoline quinone biosynthesis protein PqqB [Acidocella aromatica]MBB5372181.1 pyrroloquinoline quinone biosynthesis protein B [Acidocella aromatica]
MKVRVLGAAAGGGFPQWNCGCANCRRARTGDPQAKPRTQASLAVSADGDRWVLLNASPDLPNQINQAPCLHPKPGMLRGSPIAAVVLTGADVDCITGLLSLREGHEFGLYGPASVLDILHRNVIFDVLPGPRVPRRVLDAGATEEIRDARGEPLGLTVTPFRVGGKVPLYTEASDNIEELLSPDAVIGLDITDATGHRLVFIPGCNAVTDALRIRVDGADLLFFDGTLWHDNEMINAGLGHKSGTRMGHISVSGETGTIASFAPVKLGRRILIHINNTNPILCDDSSEAAQVRAAGWEVAYDGMEVTT